MFPLVWPVLSIWPIVSCLYDVKSIESSSVVKVRFLLLSIWQSGKHEFTFKWLISTWLDYEVSFDHAKSKGYPTSVILCDVVGTLKLTEKWKNVFFPLPIRSIEIFNRSSWSTWALECLFFRCDLLWCKSKSFNSTRSITDSQRLIFENWFSSSSSSRMRKLENRF